MKKPTLENYLYHIELLRNRYGNHPTTGQRLEQKERRERAVEWLEDMEIQFPGLANEYNETYKRDSANLRSRTAAKVQR